MCSSVLLAVAIDVVWTREVTISFLKSSALFRSPIEWLLGAQTEDEKWTSKLEGRDVVKV